MPFISFSKFPHNILRGILSFLEIYDLGRFRIAMCNKEGLPVITGALIKKRIWFIPGKEYFFSYGMGDFILRHYIIIRGCPIIKHHFLLYLIESNQKEKFELFKAALSSPKWELTPNGKNWLEFFNLELLEYLFTIGKNFNRCAKAKIPRGRPLDIYFKKACRSQHLNIVRYLVSKYPELSKYSDYIFEACCYNRLEIVEFLLSNGWTTNKLSGDGFNLLLCALELDNINIEMVKLLLERGADANYGHPSALVRAYMMSNVELIELLLTYGAKKDKVYLSKFPYEYLETKKFDNLDQFEEMLSLLHVKKI